MDVGATGAFEAVWDGQSLDLAPQGDETFADADRSMVVDILGNVEGGGQLNRVPHDDTFWFV